MRVSIPSRISQCLRASRYLASPASQARPTRPSLCTTSVALSLPATALFSVNRPNQNRNFAPPENIGDPASWYKLLKETVPKLFEEPGTSSGGDTHRVLDSSARSDLARIVILAHERANVDILTYCGASDGQWRIMRQAFIDLIRMAKRSDDSHPVRLPSNIQWPEDVLLDDLTQYPFEAKSESHPDMKKRDLSQQFSLTTKKYDKLRGTTPHRTIIGYILQSLANLVKFAASKENEESQTIMSHVIAVLRYLHIREFIPASIRDSGPIADPSALAHPSYLANIFKQMSASLLDEKASGSNYPVNVISPSLWLEYILWICIHGRWIFEGSSIVEEIFRPGSQPRWTLIDLGANETLPKARFTISAQSVTALIDGLLLLTVPMEGDGIGTKNTMPVVLNKIFAVKKVLERNEMSPSRLSWDTIIARFVDSPVLTSMETNPALMAESLNLAEPFGKGIEKTMDSNAESMNASESHEYMLDASAMVLGFYHRVLLAYIRSRNVEGTIKTLARLQKLTDANKEKSLRHFFNSLKTAPLKKMYTEPLENDWETETPFHGVHFPAYFPNIPPGVLGELLDFVTESDALELGNWMVYSQDIDGPLIPPAIYGDQNVTPSLMRFAAATNDKQLLSSLVAAQSSDVSEKTLLSLCDNRVLIGDFDGATEVLEALKGNSTSGQAIHDFARLLKSVLIQIYGVGANKELTDVSSQRAGQLLQRLLQDDITQIWDDSHGQINTIVGILSSLDPHLSSLCSSLLTSGKDFKIDLPTDAFNAIIEATMKIWGSHRAKAVYEDWCIEATARAVPHQATSSQSLNTSQKQGVAELFSRLNEQHAEDSRSESAGWIWFTGRIQPDMATIRTIVQPALEENEANTTTSKEDEMDKSRKTEILSWAAQELQNRFELTRYDVQYELQGYLPSSGYEVISENMQYSSETIRIWEVFAERRKSWALEVEERLRTFTINQGERQVLFELQPTAERILLHNLAKDFGLASESPPGDGPERQVRVYKTATSPTLPRMRIDEARTLHMWRASRASKESTLNIMPAG